jgi:hypothetical protein
VPIHNITGPNISTNSIQSQKAAAYIPTTEINDNAIQIVQPIFF